MFENIQEIINELHRMKKEYNAPQGCCVRTQERNGYRSKCLSIAIKALSEVQSLAQAKADGRLVVLPCKVGDNVYFLLQEFDGEWYISSPIRTTEIGTRGFWTSAFPVEKPNAMDDFTSWSELGKTVFLTKEEAEKALEVIRGLSHEGV
jgi:hypothetical protein